MKFEIKSRWDSNQVLFQTEAESFAACVNAAIKASANLRGADLRGADLRGADLRDANLYGANLYGADLPAPTMLLLAIWGTLSDKLTADLMLLDASAHPDPATFQKWADGGECPYTGVKVQRIANFTENRKLWGKGKPDTIHNLMVRVLKEKTKQ